MVPDNDGSSRLWRSVSWTADRLPELVALLQLSFGPEKTEDHVRWKHLEGPWGPSRGRLAVDQRGEVVGVRLLTPWRVRWKSDSAVVLRAFDGAVSPAARRQGIFAGLVAAVLQDESSSADPALAVVSTCVPASREAYRKLGWTIMPPQDRVQSLVTPSRTRLEDVAPAELLPMAGADTLGTDWDAGSLAWRTDPRSGHEYRTVCLRNGEKPNGLVFRVAEHRGVRRLVIVLVVGDLKDRRRLENAAATRQGCRVISQDGHLAALDARRRVRRSRPAGVLAVRRLDEGGTTPNPLDRQSWSLQAADLEGVL